MHSSLNLVEILVMGGILGWLLISRTTGRTRPGGDATTQNFYAVEYTDAERDRMVSSLLYNLYGTRPTGEMLEQLRRTLTK